MNDHQYKNFDVQIDDGGTVTVTLDVPGRPLNVLNHDVMGELDQIVQDLEHRAPNINLVVFQSGKESGFLAGADVETIAKIPSANEAMRLIEAGQTLFQRIEWLPMPTVAVIHGPCLGGGLEFALACRYRVARDNSSTKIGVPEIKLGLIPGWGGTQRLPRIAGLQNALSMILTGKTISARDAYKIGLVHEAIDPDRWDDSLASFLDQAKAANVPDPSRRRPLWQRLMESNRVGRSLIFRMTAKTIRSKTKHYPALAAALRAVRMSYRNSPEGYLRERDEFVGLLATPTCRNLIGLFFARERARNLQTWTEVPASIVHEQPIRRIGVIGAGTMGAGIAQLAALRDFDVLVHEVSEDAAAAGKRNIESLVDKLAKRKHWSASERAAVLNRIDVGCQLERLGECDVVIEAAVEQLEIKRQIFADLDRIVQPDAILATNTSSLSVGKIAEATARPQQVAGLHFFNPVHRMELVEVVRANQTDEVTTARLVGLVKALGKTPVVTADAPGFLVNRVLFPYLGEAIRMAHEGHSVTQIDKHVRRFGMPMGPMELLDQVGLDVALHVAKSLTGVLKGTEAVIEPLTAMVQQGYLGKKSGRGFYRYRNGKAAGPAELPWKTAKPTTINRDPTLVDDGMSSIQRRLVYPMLAEAVRCYQHHIVRYAWAIDLAMVLGTGFAPHRGGPLHVVDALEIDTVIDNLRHLQRHYGDRFECPEILVDMSRQGKTFFGRDESPLNQFAPSA